MISLIGIMGNEFFGKRMINAFDNKIEAKFFYPSLHDLGFKRKIKDVEIIHYIGSPTVSLHGVLTLLRLKAWKKKIIVHWIGADSWLALNSFTSRAYTKILKNKVNLHIAIEEELAKRLESIGIDHIIHPLPVATHYKLEPIPKEIKVLIYLPDETEYYWKRFNGEIIKKIVKEFPQIKFVIIRNSGKYFSEENVECHKWINDMESLYKKVIAVVRISEHDGFPGIIVEALSMGRHFIYSQKFPFCKTATNFEELKIDLDEIIQNPRLNNEGSEYVNKNYSLNRITDGLIKIYNEL